MSAKLLHHIVACTENRVIGRDQKLPFEVPEDKKWFYDKTANNVVVLGRVCFETWPRVMLDGRTPVVISSDPQRIRDGAAKRFGPESLKRLHVASNVTDALAIAQKLPGEIMICGGQKIYEETLPIVDRILLTIVHTELSGDTYYPEWRHLPWRELWRRESHNANYRYTFSELEAVR